MKITSQQYATALFEAVMSTDVSDHDKILDNFSRILQQNGDIQKMEEIEAEFIKLQDFQKGFVPATVVFAKKHKTDALNKLNILAGKQVKFKVDLQDALIGGVVVRVGDKMLDASIKNELSLLNNSLKE